MTIRKVISKVLLVKSFVFGALVLGIWVRSYFVSDRVNVNVGLKSTSLTAAQGLIVYRAAADGQDSIRLEQITRSYGTDTPDRVIAALPRGGADVQFGFSYDKRPMWEGGQGLVLTVTIPCWLFFILGSSKAIVWSVKRYLKRSIAPALNSAWCARCQCEQPYESCTCTQCGSPVAL